MQWRSSEDKMKSCQTSLSNIAMVATITKNISRNNQGDFRSGFAARRQLQTHLQEVSPTITRGWGGDVYIMVFDCS